MKMQIIAHNHVQVQREIKQLQHTMHLLYFNRSIPIKQLQTEGTSVKSDHKPSTDRYMTVQVYNYFKPIAHVCTKFTC